MAVEWHLIFAFLSSLLYVGGALLIKRAADLGTGLWRTNFLCNMVTVMVFVPLWLLGGNNQPLSQHWQPILIALLLVGGQALALVALSRGDISVATPALGIKTILVAFFSTLLLAQQVPLKLWVGAGMSSMAIMLLNRARVPHQHRRLVLTLSASILAALCFALFDVLVQKWSPRWGSGRLLPIMAFYTALFSLGLIPMFRAPLRAIPKPAWPCLLGGVGLIGMQSFILITTVAVYGHATSVNIVYSSRGLWSVLAVWWVGHWFSNRECELGAKVLGGRLAGAGLMTAAIILVLW